MSTTSVNYLLGGLTKVNTQMGDHLVELFLSPDPPVVQ